MNIICHRISIQKGILFDDLTSFHINVFLSRIRDYLHIKIHNITRNIQRSNTFYFRVIFVSYGIVTDRIYYAKDEGTENTVDFEIFSHRRRI